MFRRYLFPLHSLSVTSEVVTSGPCISQIWGIPWTDEQFIQQAAINGHPCVMDTHLPAVLKETVEKCLAMTDSERVDYRLKRVGYWLKALKELKPSEKVLNDGLRPEVAQILADENLLIWKQMMEAIGYSDNAVFDGFSQGTDLVGIVAETGLWPRKFVPATITEAELKDVARRERPGVLASNNFPADELTGEISRQTMEEKNDGWLVGLGPLISILSQLNTL